jgi:hypothetical protein
LSLLKSLRRLSGHEDQHTLQKLQEGPRRGGQRLPKLGVTSQSLRRVGRWGLQEKSPMAAITKTQSLKRLLEPREEESQWCNW